MKKEEKNIYMDKVEVLQESLPYIKEYSDKIIVVKIGGSMMENDQVIQQVLDDLVLMKYVGIKVVLVHGGGKQINQISIEKGIEPKFIDGLRVTDKDSIEIVKMVLIGSINTKIVSFLNRHGSIAIGVSGNDSGFIKCHKKEYIKDGKPVDLGFVGEIDNIDYNFLTGILDRNYIPVIATLGVDGQGKIYNINADTCASKITVSLGARKMILLTDVDGIMEKTKEGSKLISKLTSSECLDMIKSGKISSGMIPKVMACIDALKSGADRTHILNGTRKHSILVEIFTDKGIGTMITSKEVK
jgi:acetylglutamate kinase